MNFPKYRVAAAHIAPVFFDVQSTVDKACDAIAEASRAGAKLVAFSESFIPGYPSWARLIAPIDSHALFIRLVANSIRADGPEIGRIRAAAKRHEIYVSIGFSESTTASLGCIWNANVLISADGTILNHHRKLVPTFGEKLYWANGDGAGLRVCATEMGRIGMLICGENTNPLARYSLMAQGEHLHISTYPSTVADRASNGGPGYDLKEAIHIRAAAHSFEAKAFNIVASSPYDATAHKCLAEMSPGTAELLVDAPRAISMVLDPSGRPVSEVFCENEGLCYAEIDLAKNVEAKRVHDVTGYYNRFDVFELKVNRSRNVPIRFVADTEPSITTSGDGNAEEAAAVETIRTE